MFEGIRISPANILVTGSSGTIGTRLCELLLERGYAVSGADIRPNPWSRKVNDLTCIVDLCKPADLKKLPADIDLVIHLAANARVYDLVVNPGLARDNVLMLFNILEFCREHAIHRFLFSSSREVYGNADRPVHAETDAGTSPCESPYAASKAGGEAFVQAYHRCFGIDFIIARFSNVYGMYDTSDRVIPLFIRLTADNRDLVVYGEEKLLDFTYIDDTVDGVIRCVERFPAVKNTVFNIASGRSVPLVHVAALIRDGMGKKNRILLEKNRTGEVIRSGIDISRAQQELGYEPAVMVEEGICRSLAWYREERAR